MKLSQLISSQEALGKLISIKLPVKISFKISKLINRMQPDLKIYEEERIKLVKDLGVCTDVEKDMWTVKPENIQKWTEEMAKIQDIDIDLGFAEGKELEKIQIDELGSIDVEPKDLLSLDWLLE